MELSELFKNNVTNESKKFFLSNSGFRFDNKELIKFDCEMFGQGSGIVVGYYKCPENGPMYIIYPKYPLKNTNYPFYCFLCKESELISTPF
jgi:hypothetical protein